VNFALILFVLSILTGLVTLADALWLGARAAGQREPWWVNIRKVFPVILVVFFLRSFISTVQNSIRSMCRRLSSRLHTGKQVYLRIRLPVINRRLSTSISRGAGGHGLPLSG